MFLLIVHVGKNAMKIIIKEKCSHCAKVKEGARKKCSYCHGEGEITSEREVTEVKIPMEHLCQMFELGYYVFWRPGDQLLTKEEKE